MKSKSGFTLIEMLIAISILSLLLFTGSYIYSTLSIRWDKELGEFNQHFEQSRSLILLQELLVGVMPFVVRDTAKNEGPTMFFVGKDDSLLAVSRGGLVNTEFPEIFRLTAVANANNKYDLVYQAASTQDVLLLNTQQVIDFEDGFVIMQNLDKVEFNYFGWPSYQLKNNAVEEDGSEKASWYTNYSGVDWQLNPEKIELNITFGEQIAHLVVSLDINSQRFLEHYLSDVEEQ
ncbi:prepilin-type N-terminal cleavage/methylation domain-containing protein [Paraglaciecola sp.]|uniref:PulJ/GspJ family protein n=1 Tax=Paraglaciecola sp. TaxID=1920173 RepID=UPI0030F496F8